MKQVIKHRDGELPNMIRRTDPDDNLFMDIGVTYYTGHNLDNYINNVSDSFWGTNKGVVYDFR